jgi:GH25 family lysozyme M1 (1,4-beta-N-acetylmuramidase)
MKKTIIIIIISLFVISSGVGVFLLLNKDNKETKKDEKIVYTDASLDQNIKIIKDLNVEFGKINHLKEYIEIADATYNDLEIKYEDLGEVEVKFDYILNGIKYYRFIKFNIIDTTAPLATVPGTKYILSGSDLGFLDDFWCGDNHDKIPDKNIEGYFDLSTLGSYNVTFVAKDVSGNETRKPFTLKVVSEIPKSSSSSQSGPINYIDYNYLYNEYKTDKTKIGIDVSRWQGDIDFEALSKANVEFIMIRLGGQDGIDGEYYIDSKFTRNMENAQKYGFDVGVYFYSYAYTKEEAIKQAKYVIENLKDYKLTLPIVFDWECWNKFNKFKVSFYDVTQVQNTFLNYVESKGYKSARYGSKNYLTNVWQDSNHLTWLAHYISNTTYQGDYFMWQRCDTGKVSGINGAVDVDILYLDKYDL